MAKKKRGKKDFDKEHLRNIKAVQTRVDRAFAKATEEAALIGASIHADLPDDKIFSFDDYPKTREQVDAMLQELRESVEVTIANGVTQGWDLSNEKNDELTYRVFGGNADALTAAQKQRYFNNHSAALSAFIARKTNGLGLSDRVWNYSNSFKSEVEMALDLGIRSGQSAASMTRSLRNYLKYPDKLFRRVRDKHGLLRLSQAAKDFHPGRGVYRSSYKNARRLAATETNIAYRTADYLRWQQMDFVVGIEVLLSNNHTILLQPGETTDDPTQLRKDGTPKANAVRRLYDICDELKGRYPKDFKFTGWHPNCRCYAVSILKTFDEVAEGMEREARGEEPSSESVNTVHDTPEAFDKWVRDHADKIKSSKSVPYFIRDNQQRVDRLLGEQKSPQEIAKAVTRRVTPETIQLRRDALQSGDFIISQAHQYHENLITSSLYLGKKPLERIINHCISVDEIDAVNYIWQHPDKLRNPHISPLGEGKDMTSEKVQKNIEKKRKRGVSDYIKYEFEYAGQSWIIKTERHRAGFEQFYHIRKK